MDPRTNLFAQPVTQFIEEQKNLTEGVLIINLCFYTQGAKEAFFLDAYPNTSKPQCSHIDCDRNASLEEIVNKYLDDHPLDHFKTLRINMKKDNVIINQITKDISTPDERDILLDILIGQIEADFSQLVRENTPASYGCRIL